MKGSERMAEFCIDCMNKYILSSGKKLTEKEAVTEPDLCEGCGEWKPCVIVIKKRKFLRFLIKTVDLLLIL